MTDRFVFIRRNSDGKQRRLSEKSWELTKTSLEKDWQFEGFENEPAESNPVSTKSPEKGAQIIPKEIEGMRKSKQEAQEAKTNPEEVAHKMADAMKEADFKVPAKGNPVTGKTPPEPTDKSPN